MITLTDPETKKHLKAINCLASPVTQQVIPEMLQQIFKEIGCSGEEEINVGESYRAGNLHTNVFVNGHEYYDWLMNSPLTSIGDKITAQIRKTMVFVSHDMCQFTMTVWVSCKLPEEDFNTLDALGKVHREYKKGHMEESIYCEV